MPRLISSASALSFSACDGSLASAESASDQIEHFLFLVVVLGDFALQEATVHVAILVRSHQRTADVLFRREQFANPFA